MSLSQLHYHGHLIHAVQGVGRMLEEERFSSPTFCPFAEISIHVPSASTTSLIHEATDQPCTKQSHFTWASREPMSLKPIGFDAKCLARSARMMT
nr:hypothetical protein CFP56_08121 [Quercus suber]